MIAYSLSNAHQNIKAAPKAAFMFYCFKID